MLKRVLTGCLGILGFGASAVSAQSVPSNIIPDDTLRNERSIVKQNGSEDLIQGGAQRGQNLFHSFQEFNVGEGRSTYFLNSSNTTQNILARVTGRNRSEILGSIGVRNVPGVTSQPNLFLINPQGIVFGINADLDLRGSFIATTANAVKFEDFGLFSASQPTVPNELLTVNPSALFYTAIAPQSRITVLTQNPVEDNLFAGLQVRSEQSLLLVGGEVYLEGSFIAASGGRVEVGGLSAPGTITLNQANNLFRLEFPPNTVRSDIRLAADENGVPAAVFAESNGGGSIAIYANHLRISENSTIRTGIFNLREGAIDNQAGSLTIDAIGDIILSERGNIQNIVNPDSTGNAGDIIIKANRLQVAGGSQIRSSTFGEGNAGNITITANTVDILGTSPSGTASSVLSTVEENARGKGGDVSVRAQRVTVQEGGIITSDTSGKGNAGNLDFRVNGLLEVIGEGDTLSYVTADVTPNAEGNGGNLTIETNQLSVRNYGLISTSTAGTGNAGNFRIRAFDFVEVIGAPERRLTSEIQSEVRRGGKGDAGNLLLETNRLRVRGGAIISTTTAGTGNAGNLTVLASDSIQLDGDIPILEPLTANPGQSGNPGGLLAQVDSAAAGRAGELRVETRQLSISNGSKIQAATFGKGNANSVVIRADEIDLFNTLNTGAFFSTAINAGATRDPRFPAPRGSGGNLKIETSRLSLRNPDGASNRVEVAVNTDGIGNAGKLNIQARDLIEIVGARSSIAANVNAGAFGEGGGIKLETSRLSIRDQGRLAANSAGVGVAGNLEVDAQSIELKNRGGITAETLSGQGGTIRLAPTDYLLLRQNSQISTTAGTAQQGGDGGNININARFVIAAPGENSDISANAYTGSGGRVQINARNIFGIQPRTQQASATNDITASSQFGNSGTVTLTTFELDPSRGLTELPSTPTDPSNQINQSCSPQAQTTSSFTSVGRGGIPATPEEQLNEAAVSTNWVTLPPTRDRTSQITPSPQTVPIVEAQTWKRDRNGDILLLAGTVPVQVRSHCP